MKLIFRSILAIIVVAISTLSAPVSAQVQNADEQACINALNKSGAKVAKAQGKENAGCVKNAGRNKLNVSADACLTADLKGKIGKATANTTTAELKSCVDTPGFAYTSASTVNDGAVDNEVGLTHDVFGSFIQSAIIDASTDGVGAGCLASVVKAYEKVAAAALKEFTSCKRAGLKSETIVDAATLGNCVGTDPKDKVLAARDKLESTIVDKCVGVNLVVAFPGCGAADAPTLADCTSSAAKCRVCTAEKEMDGHTVSCDQVDNGVLDLSCAECGNNIVEPGESCDDAGESADCNPNCTLPFCGDAYVNAMAGEQCEEDVLNDSGPCPSCQTATCGDGMLCSDPACTSGPSGGPEQCDLGVDNGSGGCSIACALTAAADVQCPDRIDLTTYSGTGRTCTTNADCPVGECDDGGTGRCHTETSHDRGWTGFAHDDEGNNGFRTRAHLACSGPDPGCGECLITGIDPEPGNCRCANDNRTTCDEPLQPDSDDCGGAVCDCFLDAPRPASIGNIPVCIVERLSGDVTGTVDVDLGSSKRSEVRREILYLGTTIVEPCPTCGGTCSAPAANVGDTCGLDADCDSGNATGDGVCGSFDPVANDGLLQGTCYGGANDGQTCDIAVMNTTFPAPGGGGYSLDCGLSPGFNISGAGLRITSAKTTGALSLPAGVPCGFGPSYSDSCPCGVCSLASRRGCSSNADCGSFGPCTHASTLTFPNPCDDSVCTPTGGGEGECSAGPFAKFCDGVLRANGRGFLYCVTNSDCDPINIGVDAGDCTLQESRECLVDPIAASGVADPTAPIVASLSCTPPSSNSGYNTVVGAPGPERVVEHQATRMICPDGVTTYTPGGSCP